jgi:MFS superfamily sulfate permease-like transporter
LFGTSNQLIVGPDAATFAVIAALVTPLAAGKSFKHRQLVVTITAMTSFWRLIASRFNLGVLADFLSKPVLKGLLKGVAITLIANSFIESRLTDSAGHMNGTLDSSVNAGKIIARAKPKLRSYGSN